MPAQPVAPPSSPQVVNVDLTLSAHAAMDGCGCSSLRAQARPVRHTNTACERSHIPYTSGYFYSGNLVPRTYLRTSSSNYASLITILVTIPSRLSEPRC